MQQVSECGGVDEQHRVVFTGQPQTLVFTYEPGVMLLWNEKKTHHISLNTNTGFSAESIKGLGV